MPIDPDIAARFRLLDGLASLHEAYTTPAELKPVGRCLGLIADVVRAATGRTGRRSSP